MSTIDDRLSEFAPQAPTETLAERRARLETPSIFQGVSDAARSEWSTSWLLRQLERQPYSYDPEFSFDTLSEDKRKALIEGLDPDQYSVFADAVSMDQTMLIRDQQLGVLQRRQRLARLGWKGAALSIGASVFDPGAIAVTVASEGVLGPVAGASKAARIQRIMRAGVTNAAASTVLDTYLATQDPTRGPEDVIYGALGSFALGGLIGGAAEAFSARRLMRRIERANLKSAMGAAAGGEFESIGDLQRGKVDKFRKRSIERQLTEAHREIDPGATVDDVLDTASGAGNFTFGGNELPAEARLAIEDDPRLEDVFQLEKDNPRSKAGAEDAIDEMGWDKFLQAAKQAADNRNHRVAAAKTFFQSEYTDPQMRFLAALHDDLPRGGLKNAETIDPSRLPEGSRFKIRGRRFIVEAEGGATTFKTERGSEYTVDGQSTQRMKAPGVQYDAGDVGLKRPSTRTVYVPDDIAGTVGDWVYTSANGKARIEGNRLVVDADGTRRVQVGFQDSPDVGLHPIEFWNDGSVHVGTKITEINQTPGQRMLRQRDGELYPTLPVEALREIPIDKGSLQGPKGASHADAALTPKGEAYFRDDGNPFTDDLLDAIGLDEHADADEIAAIRDADPDEELGRLKLPDDAPPEPGLFESPPETPDDLDAGSPSGGDGGESTTSPPLPPKLPPKPGDFRPGQASDAPGRLTALRFSMAGRLGASKVPFVRKISRLLAEDALPTADGAPSTVAASAWVQRTYRSVMGRFYREYEPIVKDFLREKGVPATSRHTKRAEFSAEVGKAVRLPKDHFDAIITDPHIRKAAELVRRMNKDLLDLAKRHNVKGFSKIEANDQYLMRVWNQSAVNALVAKYGEDQVGELIGNALIPLSDDLDADKAAKIGRATLRIIRRIDDKTDLQRGLVFNPDYPELLADALRDSVPNITDAQVEDILYAARPRNPERGTPARARKRLQLDEQHRQVLTAEDGSQGSYGIDDLIHNNAEAIMHVYARQIVGHSAAAQVYEAAKLSPDDVVETWDHLRRNLVRQMEEAGVDPAVGKGLRDLKRLETIHRHILGQRLGGEMGVEVSEGLRMLRGFNYVLSSGTFGIAQVPELANLVGQVGVRAMAKQMPALGAIFRRAADGRMTDELLEEMETLAGLGMDRMIHQVVDRFDDIEGVPRLGGSRLARILDHGGKLAGDVSFMNPINRTLQLMAGATASQRILDLAMSGAKLSADRMRALGFTDDLWRRIGEQAKAHSVFTEGAFGRRVRRLNVDAWTDQQAAAALIDGIDGWASSAIQRNDIGQMAMFMTKDVGKTLLQFRTFSAAGWEKQFLHRFTVSDWAAWNSAMLGSMLGALTYIGQQYVSSIGRADAKEYRARQLSADRIATAGFSRGGFSALLPAGVDAFQQLTGGSPIFNHARYSNIDANTIFGNPSAQTVTSAAQGAQVIGREAREAIGLLPPTPLTQTETRKIFNLMPFRNVIGVRNVTDAFITRRPER